MRRALRTSGSGGVPISYRRASSRWADGGVPVMLLHGMGGDGKTWLRTARELAAAGRQVIAPDLRGHGRSGRGDSYLFGEFADDVEALCDELALERVDLVGHSLGGRTASIVAARRPERVRRLVLEEMPVPLDIGDPVPEVPQHRPTPGELWRATVSLARSPRGYIGFDRALTQSAMDQFRAPDPGWWSALDALAMPVLFLRGTGAGSMVDPQLLRRMADRLPQMRVLPVPCGHSIHRDRSDRFAPAVLEFLGHE